MKTRQLRLGKLVFRIGYDYLDILYKPKHILFYIGLSRKYSSHNAKLQIVFFRRIV